MLTVSPYQNAPERGEGATELAYVYLSWQSPTLEANGA